MWNTGPRGYTHRYNAQTPLGQLQRNITLTRRITSAGSPDNTLLMTLKHLHYNKLTKRAALTSPYYFVLGVDMTGADPMGIVRVDVRSSSPRTQPSNMVPFKCLFKKSGMTAMEDLSNKETFNDY